MHQCNCEASNAFAENHLKISSQLVSIYCPPYFNLPEHQSRICKLLRNDIIVQQFGCGCTLTDWVEV